MNRRLYRSRTDTILGGVAAGVANYLDADPALVRIAWAVLIPLTGGLAFIAYIVGWIVVPEAPREASAMTAASMPDTEDAATGGETAHQPVTTPRPRSSDGAGIWVGIGLILLGVWFLLRDYLPRIDWSYIWPLFIVGVGVMILVGATRRKG